MDVIKLFRPGMIGLLSNNKLKINLLNMSKHNFLVAIRRLYRNGWNSIINISGLAVGLTSIIFMLFYIQYETTYDSFNTNSERLYRVERTVESSRLIETWDNNPYPLAQELVNVIPEIENAANIASTANYLGFNDAMYFQKDGLFADNSFFELFSLRFLEGDQHHALDQPMSIVISESLAKKFASVGNILGKTILIDKKYECVVTGVFENHPDNSHLAIDYLISFDSFKTLYNYDPSKNWQSNSTSTYVLLDESAKKETVSDKIDDFLSSYLSQDSGYKQRLSIRPIEDIYLNTSKVRGGYGKRSEITIIYLFYAVVIFTALITALNYLNTTTAQMMSRELEIGIKKVMGSMKGHLAYQFLVESVVMIFTAFILSLILAILFLPLFNLVVDKDLTLLLSRDAPFFFKIMLGALSVAVLTGIYPVVYLSSLKVSAFLQGTSSVNRKSSLRKALVVFQLLVSMPLIFCSILITEQIEYLETRDIGFSKEDLLRSRVEITTPQEYELLKSLKTTLLQNPDILDCSFSNSAPFYGANSMDVNWEGGSLEDKIRLRFHPVDYNFLSTYQMPLLEGRKFSEEYGTDAKNGVIINETAKNLFGWENAIGKTINHGELTVVGVIQDFNDYTLFKKIPPMALTIGTEQYLNFVTIKVANNKRKESQTFINGLFNEYFPQEPIEFKFMDAEFDHSYLSSLGNVTRMFIFFTILAVFLVVIGLYSLVSYSSEMQQKMIAIRKILGAPVKSLFILMMKEYLVLYGIAAVFGIVGTYFIALEVMDVFPYHIGVKWTYLIFTSVITLLVVVISASSKIRATVLANPVDSISKNKGS
jgi:putative ABC transport system permease protein